VSERRARSGPADQGMATREGGGGRRALWERLGDRIARIMVRLDLPPRSTHLLTVVGRTTGRPRTIPLSVVVDGERRWLVSMYGESAWVKNARAVGRVILTRGRRSREYDVTEVTPPDRVPVLRSYARIEPLGRRRIGLERDSTDEEIRAVAPRVPVFRADPVSIE
jgi:deazaflavin-dependent oxidoreductase (nitroreductase family)